MTFPIQTNGCWSTNGFGELRIEKSAVDIVSLAGDSAEIAESYSRGFDFHRAVDNIVKTRRILGGHYDTISVCGAQG